MYRHLLHILSDGQKHVIADLQHTLGLNQALLKKQLKQLNAYGLDIQQCSETQYQLQTPVELFDFDNIFQAIHCPEYNFPELHLFDVVNSTNRYALECKSDIQPFVCLAEYQTAGQGRQGRQWFSPYASGICLSVKYTYTHLPLSISGVAIAIAVSIATILRELGATDVGIKWPNDIVWQSHKLAGILVESKQENGQLTVVVGMGMNVKVPSHDLDQIDRKWTDLSTVLNQQAISRNQLAITLTKSILHCLKHYEQTGLIFWLKDWPTFDVLAGKQIKLDTPQGIIESKVIGIDDKGRLCLAGHEKPYVSGEVHIVSL